MLTLAIETSNPTAGGAGIALVRDGSVLELEALRHGQRHDDALMPAIDSLCRRVAISPDRLERVAVSIGPGGYTALRIACATAKMICEVTAAQCVAVPTAAALRTHVDAPGDVFVALAYKREDCWVHHFGPGEAPTGGNARLMTFGELGASLQGGAGLIAEAALVERLGSPGERQVIAPRFDAGAVARVAELLAPIPPEQLVPLYGREPEAITKWRQLHGSRSSR